MRLTKASLKDPLTTFKVKEAKMSNWTLFSNHGHVLVCLSRDNEARLRNVAYDVGITERAVQKIVSELQQAGMISITKHGRCNRYEINTRKPMRHALEAKCTVGKLLQLFRQEEKRSGKAVSTRPEKPIKTVVAQTIESPPPIKEFKTVVTKVKKVEPEAVAPVKSSKVVVEKPKVKKKTEKKKSAAKESADNREQGSLF